MRRILFTAAAARASCAPQSAAGENGSNPNTQSADTCTSRAATAVFKVRTAPQRGWAPCGKT